MGIKDFLKDNNFQVFKGRGVVKQAIRPFYPGRVQFRATYWPARLERNSPERLEPGDLVEVLGREGLTLLVKPWP